MVKRDGTASDHLRKQAAATPQDELVAGAPRQPESTHTQALFAQALERGNLQRALKQVRQNKGAPGIDGMTVDELPEYLKHHWLAIRAQLETGNCASVALQCAKPGLPANLRTVRGDYPGH